MIGYWVDNSPIKIKSNKIRSTIYQNENRILITIASWSEKDELIDLIIEWDKIKFNKSSSSLLSPEIENLQELKNFQIGKKINIKSNEGLILILSKI
jgi:PIN domain nuclease of toxin-antitoxin system